MIRHSRVDKDLLRRRLSEEFARVGLPPADWKSKSAMYKELGGTEEHIIWGAQDEGGRILYGLITEDPERTQVWVEYAGRPESTFAKLRRIIEISANVLRRSQGPFARGLKIEQSELYETITRPLGIKVRIEKAKNIGELTVKDLVLPGIVFAVTLLSNFVGQDKSAREFFGQLSSWTISTAIAWYGIFLWAIITMLINYFSHKIEVKFDA